MSPGRIDPTASRPTQPRPPSPPRPAPPRPDRPVLCPGFGFDMLDTNYIVRASEETFRAVLSIRWRERERVVSWPDRPDGVPSYPAPPHLAAPPCAAPIRPARSVSGFWIRQVSTVIRSKVKRCAVSGEKASEAAWHGKRMGRMLEFGGQVAARSIKCPGRSQGKSKSRKAGTKCAPSKQEEREKEAEDK